MIDGKGLVLSPGFVDTHAHDDGYVFSDNSLYVKLSQGVTTTISGNCGISIGPINEKYIGVFNRITGGMLNVPFLAEMTTFGKFMDKVNSIAPGINMGFFAGHNIIRMAVMGLEMREPSREEMEKMKEYLREALDHGALGLSTGMAYPPTSFAKSDEICELAGVVKEKGGLYASHIRNEGDNLVDAVEEAIEVGRRTGVPVIISHHKALGKNNWGKVNNTLRMIEKANKEGIEVGLDVYPYTANGTGLMYILPPSCHGGDNNKLLEQLGDADFREELKKNILDKKENYDNMVLYCGLDHILITVANATPDAVGKTISDYAESVGKDPFDAALDILLENKLNVLAVFFSIAEEDLEEVLKSPYSMIGTDGMPIPHNRSITHPRLKGTFPRVLGRYVREKSVLRLEDAIRKMTSLPAQKLRLKNKGLIKEGFDADLVLFDAANIADKADYINCYAENEGIKYVIVNGRIALEHNTYTGANSGRILRRQD